MNYWYWVQRFLLSFTFGVIAFSATCSTSKGFIIKGKLSEYGAQSKVYLYKMLGYELLSFDSTLHKLGVFEFKYAAALPRGFYKIGFSKENSITIIVSNENISITGNPAIEKSIMVVGSKENDVYAAYRKYNEAQQKNTEAAQQEANQLSQQPGMTQALFDQAVIGIRSRLDSLNSIHRKNIEQLIQANPGLFITKVMAMSLPKSNVTIETYFTKEELSDPEYAAGEMIPSKMRVLYQYMLEQDITVWKNTTHFLLQQAADSSDNKQVIYLTMIPILSNQDIDYTRQLANAYVSEYPHSSLAQNLKKQLPKGAPTIGEIAPNIILTDVNGARKSLYEMRGKVVLLDFWASWCGPCRGENPNVVRAYQEYKDKGFTVFSVSLDTNKEAWLTAIQKDGLVWPNHVSDLKGWSTEPAKEYSVRGIPMTYLIDKNGYVVATNLRGEALHLKLAELLSKP
ncbi:MAG: AhpC/TSA family protein [Cytophagaceae bacterium]|jgi:thiol-disulfide isomerase/thioredoxin|nr:AhpC/TSA family protein [Cytophagaceae bacterium]